MKVSDGEIRLAEWTLKKCCTQNLEGCRTCLHTSRCTAWGHEAIPEEWDIPEPLPEPTKRQRIECQRIEWLRMLPDKEMVSVCAQRCEVCKYESRHGACEMFDCYDGMSEWWHNAVTLEQFRKDVGLK